MIMTDEDVIQEYGGQALTTEPATVYGIWMPKDNNRSIGDWYILGDGQVFHTTYRAVAEAQLQNVKRGCGDRYSVIEVREFPQPTE